MLRKIKLYGELAEFVGHKEFEVQVDSLAKAVSFLINNFKGIDKFMSPRYYQVKVGNYEIDESELTYPIGNEDIHFIPVIAGAGGRGGLGRVLLGAALIGVGVVSGGAGFGLGGGLGFGTGAGAGFGATLAAAAGNLGIALALTGLSQMLTPVETVPEDDQDPRRSFNFSGIQNTSRAGVAVPVIYGTVLTGSIVVSAGIENEQVEV